MTQSKFKRKKGKRRTKSPCDVCFLNPNACLCDVIPKLDLKSRLTLAIHHCEIRRTSNSGQLALAALKNSEMIVRGLLHEKADLSHTLSADYDTLLLFPCEEADELTPEYLQQFKKPIHLIVPDGNWRQAGKVHYRHKEISHIPRVMLPVQEIESLRLRKESSDIGMATLQAIAHALGIIEGEEVRKALLDLYDTKAERTLWARGVIASEDCVTFTPGKRS